VKEAAERAEAHRLISLSLRMFPDAKPEDFTCLGCAGAKLWKTEHPTQLSAWADLRKYNSKARTLCAFAWDDYNTNGDCLAAK
jgi:hypothetical protein